MSNDHSHKQLIITYLWGIMWGFVLGITVSYLIL